MGIGIYIDTKNSIVYAGNRKKKDPSGLTWVHGIENKAGFKFEYGFYSHIYNGSEVVLNPDYITAKSSEKSRSFDIKAEQNISDMKLDTVQSAKDKIDTIFNAIREKPTDTLKLDALINKCEIIFEKITIELLK